jgi:hypothetical protein
MYWNTTLVERLRYYIGDLDITAYEWTDGQLEKFLAIAAITVTTDLLHWETVINGPYIINTSLSGSGMIVPDPVDNAPAGFSNLIVFQAACLMARSNVKKSAAQGAGWKIIDDRSTIDGTNVIDALISISDDYCSSYSMTLKEFKEGNKYAGHSVLSPYASPNHSRSTIFQWHGRSI